jgi:hypothetical protein
VVVIFHTANLSQPSRYRKSSSCKSAPLPVSHAIHPDSRTSKTRHKADHPRSSCKQSSRPKKGTYTPGTPTRQIYSVWTSRSPTISMRSALLFNRRPQSLPTCHNATTPTLANYVLHTGQGKPGYRCRYRASPPRPLHSLREILSLVPVCWIARSRCCIHCFTCFNLA